MANVHHFKVRTPQGTPLDLSVYRDKVLLIVNTASRCGFTPQYQDLEQLYQQYHQRGLEIIAFPCNQFGGQEPGSEDEIKSFCDINYKVGFPLFSKVEVNGSGAHPLFQYLTHEVPGILGTEAIKWNFTKFLIGRDGVPIARYAPATKPESIAADIRKALGQ